jgi:hypothetical protein
VAPGVCARRQIDEQVKPTMLEVFNANYRVYARRKMKAALRREHGIVLDKDRISRLMRELGIRGATRSKTMVTTRPDRSSPRAGVDLEQSVIENLAAGIASGIDYAFDFHWRPRWVPRGDAHRWSEVSESGVERHFVECLRCRLITVHAVASEGDAWYSQHIREHA